MYSLSYIFKLKIQELEAMEKFKIEKLIKAKEEQLVLKNTFVNSKYLT